MLGRIGASRNAAAFEGTGPIEGGTEPVLTHPTPIGDLSYTPGRGLQVGDTGLNLGGYTDLVVTRDEGEDAKLVLQDLSFLVLWRVTQRLHLYSELEIEDVFE